MIDSNILYCPRTELSLQQILQAGWQSGYAAACKAVNAGSIPASASIGINFLDPWNGSSFQLSSNLFYRYDNSFRDYFGAISA